MLRKMIFGLVIASLVGMMVYGGIYRTSQRSITRIGTGNVGNRELIDHSFTDGNNGSGKGKSDISVERNRTNSDEAGLKLNDASSQNDHSFSSSVGLLTIRGTAGEITTEKFTINTDADGEMEIDGRAWRFVQESGFSASVGDAISVSGFWDEFGTFEPSVIENLSMQTMVVIRDEAGRPEWAGGGQGNQ